MDENKNYPVEEPKNESVNNFDTRANYQAQNSDSGANYQPQTTASESNLQTEKVKKKSKLPLIIGIAAVALVAVLAVVLILLGGQNNKGGNNKSDSDKEDEEVVEKFTVTFDSDGGTKVKSQKVKKGGKLNFPTNPQKEGYMFLGWYVGDEQWSFENDVVTKDITLKAKWGSIISVGTLYSVDFDTRGYGDIPSAYVSPGITVPRPKNPDNENFLYWSVDGVTPWDFDNDVVYSDITLIAVYDDDDDLTFTLEYAEGTVLRMATGYNNHMTGLSFNASVAGEGITLADGKIYHTGDLKPTWAEVSKILSIHFEDKYQGNTAQREWMYWQDQLDRVDMISGTSAQLSEAGNAGKLINLADYLDDMPNLKKFLKENPAVYLSIVADINTGAFYHTPCFDGISDVERVPLMRTDWVEKLLNGEGDFYAESCHNIVSGYYDPYMPSSGKIVIDVVNPDGTGTEKVTKNYDAAGNIVALMNEAGNISGVEAVNMLRDYIDIAYNGYYGTNRADLFIGQNAAWDADELVALLRCVVANPQTLNGTDSVQGLFSREDDNNQRRVDMFRFAGTLFGVRGLESRQEYLYVGADGLLHDARMEEDTYIALEKMNAMVREGLISTSFVNKEDTDSGQMLQEDRGFMHYDYNQTQTVYNETKLDEDEKYMAVMIPVARWFDGTYPNGVYMRFTESWRSVKTDGWAISKAGVGNDTNKLHAALALIDYAYSEKGRILMSYGPDAFIAKNDDGSYVTFDYNGKEMPVIADAAYYELWDRAYGNYINYARQYLGSCIGFVKSQAFEYQCTHPVGQQGYKKISNAIKYGVIKHPELYMTENPWYSIVPTILPTTNQEKNIIAGFTELGANGLFSSNKNGINLFLDIIVNDYTGEGLDSRSAVLNTVSINWNGATYLAIMNNAYQKIVRFYEISVVINN